MAWTLFLFSWLIFVIGSVLLVLHLFAIIAVIADPKAGMPSTRGLLHLFFPFAMIGIGIGLWFVSYALWGAGL